MAGKKQQDVYVVIGTVTYGGPNVLGVYANLQTANAAAYGPNVIGGSVIQQSINFTDSASDATASGETTSKAKSQAKTPQTGKDANGEGTTKRASTKTTIPDGRPGSLAGLKLAFTGTFSTMDRKTCENTVNTYGGEFVNKLAESDYVVLGNKPGPKKLEEINDGGLTTMTEDEFFSRIGAVLERPTKKAKTS